MERLGVVLNNLGVWIGDRYNDAGLPFFEESYRTWAEMGDLSRMALSLCNLAATIFESGRMSQAREYATEALALARNVGDRRQMHQALDNLGYIAFADARFDEAHALFMEALTYAHEIANARLARQSLYGLAGIAAAMGEGQLAARLAAVVDAEAHGGGIPMIEKTLAAAKAQTGPAEWEAASATGAALTIEQVAAETLAT